MISFSATLLQTEFQIFVLPQRIEMTKFITAIASLIKRRAYLKIQQMLRQTPAITP